MASIALLTSAPSNFGMMNATSVHFNPNPSKPTTTSSTPSYEVNLQQVGEEVEGIVMLSLLKQKLESFSEIIRQKSRVVEERDSDDENAHSLSYGRGKRRAAATHHHHASSLHNVTFSSPYSPTPASPKRRRERREEEPLEISSRNSWMENFAVVKRLSQLSDAERRQIETIQMNEWIEQQYAQYHRRQLSEERVELLRMIGVDVEEPNNSSTSTFSSSSNNNNHNNNNNNNSMLNDRPSSPDPTWDDDYDDLSSSGKEQSPPLRKKRRSPPISLPASPAAGMMMGSSSSSNMGNNGVAGMDKLRKKIPGKKKANLKRNSLHNWVYNQRRLQYEGNLPIHRKKLLDKIGFDWKWVQQKIDEEKQQQLAQGGVAADPSSMNLPMDPHSSPMHQQLSSSFAAGGGNTSSSNVSLTSSPARGHSSEELEVLEPIPNSKSEELWMTRYRELIEFKERHGHYEVPRYVE